VFSKYYRSAAAHRLSSAGLGLYVVQQLAQALGGRVTLEQHTTDRVTFYWDLNAA
jgi:K+-sensing histidine kinase KdpD